MARIVAPANCLLVFEWVPQDTPRSISASDFKWLIQNTPANGTAVLQYKSVTRHQQGANYILSDGHAKWIPLPQVSLNDDPNANDGLSYWFSPLRNR